MKDKLTTEPEGSEEWHTLQGCPPRGKGSEGSKEQRRQGPQLLDKCILYPKGLGLFPEHVSVLIDSHLNF